MKSNMRARHQHTNTPTHQHSNTPLLHYSAIRPPTPVTRHPMIAQFAVELLFGMSLMWAVMPRGRVFTGFFRVQMLVALGLGVLAAAAVGWLGGDSLGMQALTTGRHRQTAIGMCVFIAAAAYVGSVLWTLNRRRAGFITGLLIVGAAGTLLVASAVGSEGSSVGSSPVFRTTSHFTSAGLLGAVVTGMLLGHAYLTDPGMPLDPLKSLNAYLALAGAARLIVSAVALTQAGSHLADAGGTVLSWLALRWVAGIVGPLVVSFMVWRILRYRNTQAATGVLFVGVILVFIGEMSGALLERELSVPL